MNQTVNVNFKLDLDVKKKMESACAAMGLSLSTAFTLFARKVEVKEEFHLKFLPILLRVKTILQCLKSE